MQYNRLIEIPSALYKLGWCNRDILYGNIRISPSKNIFKERKHRIIERQDGQKFRDINILANLAQTSSSSGLEAIVLPGSVSAIQI